MNADLVLLVPLMWGFYKGFKKGLIVELASILAIILGIYGCAKFSDLVAHFLGAQMHSSVSAVYLSIIADVLVFLGVVMLVFFIAKRIQKVAEALFLGIANRLLGGLFGAFKWALLLSVLLYFFDILNSRANLISHETLDHSWVYQHLMMIAPMVIPALVKSKSKLLI
jgi:membrane protein required for colicin V production